MYICHFFLRHTTFGYPLRECEVLSNVCTVTVTSLPPSLDPADRTLAFIPIAKKGYRTHCHLSSSLFGPLDPKKPSRTPRLVYLGSTTFLLGALAFSESAREIDNRWIQRYSKGYTVCSSAELAAADVILAVS